MTSFPWDDDTIADALPDPTPTEPPIPPADDAALDQAAATAYAAADGLSSGFATGGLEGPDPMRTARSSLTAELVARTDDLFDPRGLVGLFAVRDPNVIREGSARIADSLVDYVRSIATRARGDRAEVVAHKSELREEATTLADAAELCRAIAHAFTKAADEAVVLAGDLVASLPLRGETAPKSFRVGDGHGLDLVVKVEQGSELKVDVDEVVEVIVANLVDDGDDLPGPVLAAYARGLRGGIAAFRELLSSSPTFRSTALDGLVSRLEDAREDDLAKRLAKAYRKAPKGEAKPKIERVAPAAPKGGTR